jgi:hypothetical protein
MEQVVGGGAAKSPVEAPYFTGVEHVEEPSECLCLLIEKTSYEYMMGCSTNLILGKLAGYVTGLEQLVRGPPGAEEVEAPYFTDVEHVQEPRAFHDHGQMARGGAPES